MNGIVIDLALLDPRRSLLSESTCQKPDFSGTTKGYFWSYPIPKAQSLQQADSSVLIRELRVGPFLIAAITRQSKSLPDLA
jgi:hypothetical protein